MPVVVFTANEETKRRALGAGAIDFLLKAFDHTEVALRIRNLLKSRRAHLLLDNQPAALEDAVREHEFESTDPMAQQQKDSKRPPRSSSSSKSPKGKRKEIKALTASLKKQAAEIQKASAQLELRRPASQMVLDDQ